MEPACKSEVHTARGTLNWRVQDEYELDWGKQYANKGNLDRGGLVEN